MYFTSTKHILFTRESFNFFQHEDLATNICGNIFDFIATLENLSILHGKPKILNTLISHHWFIIYKVTAPLWCDFLCSAFYQSKSG